MKGSNTARLYDHLTPEERFRLILAASGRGDEAERDRLARAGSRITLSLPDHAPYAEAFDEFALLTFIELLDEVARFHDAWLRVRDAEDDALPTREADNPEGPDRDRLPRAKRPVAERLLDLALAAGYMLRTKAEGWKLFCDRLSVPPFLLWEGMPGYARVVGCLGITETAAFTAEGFLRWLNAVRPAGAPRVTALALTADGLADSLEAMFRDRAKYHAGG